MLADWRAAARRERERNLPGRPMAGNTRGAFDPRPFGAGRGNRGAGQVGRLALRRS
jgi:hypothetical protein